MSLATGQPSLPCGIALGSNVGDRLSHLRRGLTLLLERLPQARLTAAAPLYETAPVDCAEDSPAFYNTVVELECALPPHDLRAVTAGIERALGRPDERVQNAPRTLDLDLLYCGQFTLADDTLTLPHPRLAQRRFVLQPLAAIRPNLRLQGQSLTVRELLAALPPGDDVIEVTPQWWHDETSRPTTDH